MCLADLAITLADFRVAAVIQKKPIDRTDTLVIKTLKRSTQIFRRPILRCDDATQLGFAAVPNIPAAT